MPDDAVEAAARRLYALPLDRFTAARDELARELRAQGQRDAADAVRALRKPTGAAWAVNQLAHHRGRDVGELLDAGGRLRAAQEQLLGGGDRRALDEARAHERELVARLAQDATVIAAEAGLSPTTALLERIRSTLHAAAVDADVAGELGAGRLVREREASGLAASAAAAPPPVAPRREAGATRDELQAAQRAAREATRRAAAAQRKLARARERADAALQELRSAEAEEADALRAARAAQAAVSRLEARLRR